MGELAKGGAVVSRLGTRDRSGWVFAPRAKKLVNLVSNKGIRRGKEGGLK
jgi:hypothetical protein